MLRTAPAALLFGAIVLVALPVHARRPDLLLVEWDELTDEPATATNPLYEDPGTTGTSPLYEPRSVSVNSTDLWQGAPIRLELQLDNELPPGVEVPDDAYVFSVALFDQATDQPITQFPNGVTFTFDIPHLTETDRQNMALGYLDETKNPPMWVSEDRTIDPCNEPGGSGSQVCGKTTHFTTFVIGPANGVPEPGSLALLSGALLFIKRRKAAR